MSQHCCVVRIMAFARAPLGVISQLADEGTMKTADLPLAFLSITHQGLKST